MVTNTNWYRLKLYTVNSSLTIIYHCIQLFTLAVNQWCTTLTRQGCYFSLIFVNLFNHFCILSWKHRERLSWHCYTWSLDLLLTFLWLWNIFFVPSDYNSGRRLNYYPCLYDIYYMTVLQDMILTDKLCLLDKILVLQALILKSFASIFLSRLWVSSSNLRKLSPIPGPTDFELSNKTWRMQDSNLMDINLMSN